MRNLEIFLIAANVITLCLHFRERRTSTWLWSSAINLTLFVLHGLFEGLRYQMTFSYLFVFWLILLTWIKVNRPAKARAHPLLKTIALSLALLSIVLGAFLAYAFPVFKLPKPSGEYAVGIQYFHLIDANRLEPFLDHTTQKRELMIKVYYPAIPDPSKHFAPYFHSPQLVRAFAEFYNLPDFAFDHLNLVTTNSKEGLLVSNAQPNYPVILFSHGAGTSMEVHTAQCEDLASHGYIVVAIDHPYVSAATVFPDRIVSHREATTDFKVAEPAVVITQIMADDASFVIDQLTELNAGQYASPLKGKLDLEKLGAMGHSVGGAVAYNLALNDRRIKAAIDLDGVVYIAPTGDPQQVIPFLMLANDRYHIQAIQQRIPLMKRFEDMNEIDQKITLDVYGNQANYQAAYVKAQQNVIGFTDILKSSGNLFTITGSDHMKFTDLGLFIAVPQLRQLLGIGGETSPVRVLGITEAVTVTFFDHYLKREAQIPDDLLQIYPELKRIQFQ